MGHPQRQKSIKGYEGLYQKIFQLSLSREVRSMLYPRNPKLHSKFGLGEFSFSFPIFLILTKRAKLQGQRNKIEDIEVKMGGSTTVSPFTFTITLVSFATGFAVAHVLGKVGLRESRRKFKKNAGATIEGKDHSLFYPDDHEITGDADASPGTKEMSRSRPEWKFLPSEFYGQMVRDCIICCVDCVVVRRNPLGAKECLLVERSDEPAKGHWWLPGGRIYKGETFFQAAKRKCVEETGVEGKPIQVLGVYNTFFPRSSWDNDVTKGTQTVNAVVLVYIDDESKVRLDDTSERYRWLAIDSSEDLLMEEDKYVFEQIKRMEAWNMTFEYD